MQIVWGRVELNCFLNLAGEPPNLDFVDDAEDEAMHFRQFNF